jgi:hypothetical protein
MHAIQIDRPGGTVCCLVPVDGRSGHSFHPGVLGCACGQSG